jgi:hypothetical protein
MRIPLIVGLAALGLVRPCPAVEVGLGLSLRNTDASIYLPITLSPAWTLEPRFTFRHDHGEATSGPGRATSNSSSQAFDVGIFWTRPLSDRTRLYVGPRIGFDHAVARNASR